jgi:hypothetical protein
MESFSSGTEVLMPGIAKKARLSVRNWREYNESLVARGSITFWFSDEALKTWYHDNGEGKRGRPFTYSDSTMELFLSIRELLRSSVCVLCVLDTESSFSRNHRRAPAISSSTGCRCSHELNCDIFCVGRRPALL